MATTADWRFDVFRVDVGNACVWQGKEALKLTPKAFAVLHYLLGHAGQLVTREALWREVWQGIAVTDAALNMCVIEVRKALGDNARTPRFIETVHRRGYRFVGKVVSSQHAAASSDFSLQSSVLSPQSSILVGREAELFHLQQCVDKALNSERQLVFITGEPGIGKTAVVEAFLNGLASRVPSRESKDQQHAGIWTLDPRPQTLDPALWLARGYCVESYGAGEAYLPVLTALEALSRTVGREQFLPLLQQHAPMWLAQLPSFLPPPEREALQRQLAGVTAQRMLREMANFLTVLTATQPLVLVLEDLHWSDPSTVALLAYLARWPERLRLLVVGTYRPAEVLSRQHPLAAVHRELTGQGLGTDVTLSFLPEGAVAKYLQHRTSDTMSLSPLASTLYQQTAGHPLFMVATVEEWLTQKQSSGNKGANGTQPSVASADGRVPERFRQFVAVQMARLPRKEQQLLEIASVAGFEFSAAEIAAGLGADEVETEEQCEQLAQRQQFLRPAGISEWPDGTVAARYGFRHAVYQSLWQERIKAGRWRKYHRQIGERKETAYGDRAGEIAAELALHFEQGRDYQRAVQYLQQAARNSIRRSAYVEANHHLATGLKWVKTLPDTPERAQQELELQNARSLTLGFTKGFAAPEIAVVVRRMQELGQQVREVQQRLAVLGNLHSLHVTRAEHQTALKMAEQFLALATSVQHPVVFLIAHYNLGWSLLYMGNFALAREHQERGIAFYNPQQHHSLLLQYNSFDPGIAFLSVGALTLWHLGYPEQALKRSQAGLTLAQELAHPFSLAVALITAASFHQHRREVQTVQERAEAVIALCSEQGFIFYLAGGTILRAWALAMQGRGEEGIPQIRQGIAAYRATGAAVFLPFFHALLAEAYAQGGQTEEGLNVLAEALTVVDKTEERKYEAELYRLKGELTLQQSRTSLEQVSDKSRTSHKKSKVSNPQHPIPNTQAEEEAEACFLKAIAVAQRQQAKSWELRATMSLVRLRQQQVLQHASRNTHHATHAKLDAARTILADVYNWFTEGFDTKDLQEAKALLEELSHRGIESLNH